MTRFVYVLPAGRFRWEVRVAETMPPVGTALPVTNTHSQLYRRKAHALIAARAIAILIGGEVQPHNRWGRIQDPDSYGPDDPKRFG